MSKGHCYELWMDGTQRIRLASKDCIPHNIMHNMNRPVKNFVRPSRVNNVTF